LQTPLREAVRACRAGGQVSFRADAERMTEKRAEGAWPAFAVGPLIGRRLEDGGIAPDDLPLTRAVLGAIRVDEHLVISSHALHDRQQKGS
jgi:hypothetical protein